MWRRKLIAALAGLVMLAGVGAFLALRPATAAQVTRENFDRIQKGMMQAEVEAILGPPGDYLTGPVKQAGGNSRKGFVDTAELGFANMSERTGTGLWWCDTGHIFVVYGRSGTVVFRSYIPMERTPQAPLDDLRWRVEHQWLKWFPRK
jgi:hypothetical protein